MTAGTRTLQPADGEGLDARPGRRGARPPVHRRAGPAPAGHPHPRGHVRPEAARRRARARARRHLPTADAGPDPRRRPGCDRAARDRAALAGLPGRPARRRPAAGGGRPGGHPRPDRRRSGEAPAAARLELRNADEKIVVRVELDEPDEAAPARPPTVTVRELRGYADEAARAVKALVDRGTPPGPGPGRGRRRPGTYAGRRPPAAGSRPAGGRPRWVRDRPGRQPARPAGRRGHRVPARLPGRGAPHPVDPEARPAGAARRHARPSGSRPSSGSAT